MQTREDEQEGEGKITEMGGGETGEIVEKREGKKKGRRRTYNLKEE